MCGRGLLRLIVPSPAANVIVLPGAPFASRIACRSEPAPESAVLLTTNCAAKAVVLRRQLAAATQVARKPPADGPDDFVIGGAF
jgi:hypothetical protein